MNVEISNALDKVRYYSALSNPKWYLSNNKPVHWVTFSRVISYFDKGVRDLDIHSIRSLRICTYFTLISHVQPDDGHHEGPKHVVAS
jgi:hypothetical protein